jgi:tight adherence protein B
MLAAAALLALAAARDATPPGWERIAAAGRAALARRSDCRRRRALSEQLPSAVAVLAAHVEAGRSLAQAIGACDADLPEPIDAAMRRAGDRVALGAAPADALADLADGEDADLVVAAIALQHRAGGNLARLLDGLAEAIIRREEGRRAAAVATAQARATGAMVTALPALGLLALRAADPAAFALLLSSPLGWAALTASAALALAGHLLIRRLATVDR